MTANKLPVVLNETNSVLTFYSEYITIQINIYRGSLSVNLD